VLFDFVVIFCFTTLGRTKLFIILDSRNERRLKVSFVTYTDSLYYHLFSIMQRVHTVKYTC